MRKVFVYLRVSGAKQLDGYGFDRQLDTIEKYCKRSKYQIEKVFKEQVSGAKDKEERAVFTDMVKEMLTDSVRIIVIESLDRFARELRIAETLMIFLIDKGITLINATNGENLTESTKDDPMKKCLIQMQGAISELERRLIIKRLQDGRKRSDKKMGRKPYGMKEGEQEILERMRSLRRATKTRKRLSFAKIAARLNEEGIKTRQGKVWNAVLVFYALQK